MDIFLLQVCECSCAQRASSFGKSSNKQEVVQILVNNRGGFTSLWKFLQPNVTHGSI